MNEFKGIKSKAIPLSEVEININYALVITTNGGLWRYIIGDTVIFTSLNPYKIKISGRTKSYINCFGEELIVENADLAVAHACNKTNSNIKEYTACPIFMKNNTKGAHEWLFEFSKKPMNLKGFAKLLDQKLQEINTDYRAKRENDLILDFPEVKIAKEKTFEKWLKSNNKLGAQNKIPRLLNSREIMEQLLKIKD